MEGIERLNYNIKIMLATPFQYRQGVGSVFSNSSLFFCFLLLFFVFNGLLFNHFFSFLHE